MMTSYVYSKVSVKHFCCINKIEWINCLCTDSEFTVDEADILIAANREGEPSGIAYIRFFNSKVAFDAQQVLDGTEIAGRKLRVGILEGAREADTCLSLY